MPDADAPIQERTAKRLPFAGGTRSGGVLLHVTSLPGGHGVGDLGPAARRWVDLLADAHQSWWQMLPLVPPGLGDSPYNGLSSMAGNPLLISLDDLVTDGLLTSADLADAPASAGTVDFARAGGFKTAMLRKAWRNARTRATPGHADAERAFRDRAAHWLNDYAVFSALRDVHNGRPWQDWPAALRCHDPAALAVARRDHADAIDFVDFVQFVFARQLAALRAYAHARGVGLIGDLPMFVSGASADVWANPHLFQLDADRRPTAVAGCPPDSFSATGQLWQTPLYDWAAMAADEYRWWAARLAAAFGQADAVRLDHFRGFAAYWRIPAGHTTAEHGRWTDGPGRAFFDAMRDALGPVQFIAEDLGLITPDVHSLRRDLGLPGMRVLQFGFDNAPDPYHAPHHFTPDHVAYAGTHDNDTTAGWFAALTPDARRRFAAYVGVDPAAGPAWTLVRLAWASVAGLAVVTAQDLLGLASDARMNRPGTETGNWAWRLTDFDRIGPALERLSRLSITYTRV